MKALFCVSLIVSLASARVTVPMGVREVSCPPHDVKMLAEATVVREESLYGPEIEIQGVGWEAKEVRTQRYYPRTYISTERHHPGYKYEGEYGDLALCFVIPDTLMPPVTKRRHPREAEIWVEITYDDAVGELQRQTYNLAARLDYGSPSMMSFKGKGRRPFILEIFWAYVGKYQMQTDVLKGAKKLRTGLVWRYNSIDSVTETYGPVTFWRNDLRELRKVVTYRFDWRTMLLRKIKERKELGDTVFSYLPEELRKKIAEEVPRPLIKQGLAAIERYLKMKIDKQPDQTKLDE